MCKRPPLKTNRQATFYQGVSPSDYLKCTPLACLSSSVLKCSEARHSFRQQRSILINLQNDVRHPCSISFNFKYHVLHFGNRLHRSVWRLSQALQLVHADFPRHASERLFLRILALGSSMALYLFYPIHQNIARIANAVLVTIKV